MDSDATWFGWVPELAMASAHGDDVPPIIVELFKDFDDLRRHRCSNAAGSIAMTPLVAA